MKKDLQDFARTMWDSHPENRFSLDNLKPPVDLMFLMKAGLGHEKLNQIL